MGRVGGTTALLDEIPRSLVQAGNSGTPLLPLVEYPDRGSTRSHGVGHPALSAKRLAAGWMAGTMALPATGEPSTMRQRADTMTALQRAGWHLRSTGWNPPMGWESRSGSHWLNTPRVDPPEAVMPGALPHSATARPSGQRAGHGRAAR